MAKTDWESVKSDYTAGQLSIRAIALLPLLVLRDMSGRLSSNEKSNSLPPFFRMTFRFSYTFSYTRKNKTI
ncbi:hypothetical protein Dd586_2403 [Dickeya parazeae Ech586]|uniref:Uncharacterized protein n=1 Tax=Dickeya zeae (strain Ech586) TaxID=590409 RepID=D2C289_DICZ5|nr:hypothetical protein Dd586_2403 [Dickeya parazeae Ech586]